MEVKDFRQRKQNLNKPEIIESCDHMRRRKKISSISDFSVKAWILVTITLPVGLFTLYCFFLFWTVGLPSPTDVAENVYHFTNDVHRSLSSDCPLWLSSKELQEIQNSQDYLIVLDKERVLETEDYIRRSHPFVFRKTVDLRNVKVPSDGLDTCESVQSKYSPLILHWQTQSKINMKDINLKLDDCFSGIVNLRLMSNSDLEENLYKLLTSRRLNYFKKSLNVIELLYLYIAKKNFGIPPKFPNECGIFTLHQISGVSNYSLSWPIGNHGLIEMNKPKHFQLNAGDMVIFFSGMRLHMEGVSSCSMSAMERVKDKFYCPLDN